MSTSHHAAYFILTKMMVLFGLLSYSCLVTVLQHNVNQKCLTKSGLDTKKVKVHHFSVSMILRRRGLLFPSRMFRTNTIASHGLCVLSNLACIHSFTVIVSIWKQGYWINCALKQQDAHVLRTFNTRSELFNGENIIKHSIHDVQVHVQSMIRW